MIFVRENTAPAATEPRRNAVCSCGSGKKYKRCCGRSTESRHPKHVDDALVVSRRKFLDDPSFQRGLLLQREGALAEARAIYEQLLTQQPRHAAALHVLGALLLQQGEIKPATELLQRSIDVNPGTAKAHSDLGNALYAAGQAEAAIASYDRAITLDPRLCEALFNRSVALQKLRRLEAALQSCEQAIELHSELIVALYNRAVLLSELDRTEDALAAYERCLQVSPNHVEALNNRAAILLTLEQPEAALASLEAALRIAPRAAEALQNRGNALRRLSRNTEAIASYDEALRVRPQLFEALLNRGHAQRQLAAQEAALASLDAALKLRPSSQEALFARAEVLADLERYAEASATLVELLGYAPDVDFAPGLSLYLQSIVCDWEGFDARKRGVVAAVTAGRRVAAPPALLTLSDSAAAQAACARLFVSERFPVPIGGQQRRRYEHDRLRIAYLSADLRAHPVSRLLVRVLELHDRKRFQIFGLSLRPPEQDSFGERVRAAFDELIDVSSMSGAAIADLIARREVDILVDLMGFTNGSRFEILAARPAPVQVSFLGFPGTTGAAFIDYIIADEFLIPRHLAPHYSEQVVWLPECFQPNDDWEASPLQAPTRAELSLPDGAFVFCCFSNNYKMNPECFDIWMRVLGAVPRSVLWLLADSDAVATNLRAEAERRGIDANRLVFAERGSYADYLARLSRADLFLDTFPFNAGATASDVLRAGVPIVTRSGEALASRMAGSLLRAVGLPELISASFQAYEALAVRIATTPGLIGALRARLAEARGRSPLFDSDRYCRHLEWAYTQMSQRAQRGEAASALTVEPNVS
jgi:predicted O-linked N-acetylglucosamine transferase (SPINDLY family)